MDSNRCESGYPCSKYEVRKITTQEELWYYAKVLVSSAHSRGVDPDIIITMLLATLNDLPLDGGITCPNFNEFGKTSAEICEYIITNPEVPPYKNCTTLYKRVDSKLSACRLCKYHDSLFRNENELVERSVVKYMLQSEDNLSLVADYLDVDFFTSCIDVSLGIPVSKAYAIPMMRILVTSLLKPNIRTFLFSSMDASFFSMENSSAFDTVWDDAYSDFPRKRKLPVVLTNNPVWKDVIKKFVKECIDTAPDLSKEGFMKVADAYLKRKEIDKQKVFASAEPKKDDYVQMDFDDAQLSPIEEVTTADESISEASGSIQPVPETFSEKNEPSAEETIESGISSGTESVVEDYSEEELFTTSSSDDSTTKSSRRFSSSVLSARNVILHLSLADKYIHKKPLLIKDGESVPKEYKNGKVILLDRNTSLPGAFYHGVLRDKQLPVEVVNRDDGTFLYIFYSRHMNKFFCASPSDAPLQVKELLSRSMIQKLCHTPYLLYGVSKAYSLPVKNVFSIQTAHGRMVPGKELLPYKNLLNAYPLSKAFGQNIPTQLCDACLFFGGMPTYRSVCKVLTGMLDSSNNMVEFLEDTLLDEALGCSYLYSINFEDSGPLMILVENGKFLFKEEFNRSKKNDGIYLSYLVRDLKSSYGLFNFILQRLAHRGIFRTCNLQVIGVHNGTMNMFVSLDEEEYIATVIDLLIFEYGRTYTQQGISVSSMRYK